tara:strand:- start:874 stop:2019 length:1146 start_codon:yes stop_codon:yes gene_type:complete
MFVFFIMSDDLRQSIIYHQVEPQATQDTYTEFDNVDFVINVGEGRRLLNNSVRVLGDLRVTSNGAAVSAVNIGFDRCAGAHAFVDSVQVSSLQQGLIESITNYGRYVSMSSHASENRLDLLNSDKICELKGYTDIWTNLVGQQINTYAGDSGGTATPADVDFSMKPNCCLSKMSGDDLPSSKTGAITLTLNLARNRIALMGSGQTAASTYELRNLRVSYRSVADDGSASQTAMRTIYNIKSNILSGNASISANVPALCSSVVMSFCDTRHENSIVDNALALEEPQALTEVQYLFNDQTNSLITYVLSDRTEMLERFIDAMSTSGHNQVAKDVFKANQGFALGLDFDGLVDLSRNRFTVQLQTGANNVPSNAYLYFSSQAVI